MATVAMKPGLAPLVIRSGYTVESGCMVTLAIKSGLATVASQVWLQVWLCALSGLIAWLQWQDRSSYTVGSGCMITVAINSGLATLVIRSGYRSGYTGIQVWLCTLSGLITWSFWQSRLATLASQF